MNLREKIDPEEIAPMNTVKQRMPARGGGGRKRQRKKSSGKAKAGGY